MKIIKARADRQLPPNTFYCGRAFGGHRLSVLANPFVIGTHGTRAEVIEKFRSFLWDKIQIRDEAVLEALRVVPKYDQLACWCCEGDADSLPANSCHAQVIWRAVQWLMGRDIK